ncbi:YqeG family HAD IIIA-type phosphatase [Companilactobacillus alimentarius]|uniref:Haloacid dehalogenase n=1 Tax=Companilactobacillus alimentarius DSM 20249 TaxID=1423720 RepID=A0A2K9HGG8_9LACO|nr:YqeG family HAD IIIA-type phosphatase [Companilactobacillus alimentarius]AUI71468.1 haloacid dehalogenase [Companilactobacillus alimentarius DSM 20249]KRK74627.1 haloacid dehalogenase family hydrolase [Companilactobacillus alimentarius DSM 20249]MDT6951200.1 YqeG family HAD IIIA-type phosphatase [Companilactobacillus alimentarius]GEO44465.1 haloacid dehalogenase [Companilactobacillus alimentarius]
MFKPYIMLDKITDIEIGDLKQLGITTIMTDLDNTLLPWNSNRYDLSLRKWLNQMSKNDIEVMIVSNNSYERVEKAVEELPVSIVARAVKPLPFVIMNHIREEKINPANVLFVGDQVMTDVLAGNMAGLKTVLVKPLVKTDAKKTRVNRFFERPILKIMQKRDKNLYWKDSLNDRN